MVIICVYASKVTPTHLVAWTVFLRFLDIALMSTAGSCAEKFFHCCMVASLLAELDDS